MLTLGHPLDPMPPILQDYGHRWPAMEPEGYLFPDGSIGYVYVAGAHKGHWHNGLDFGAECGTPLRAMASGTVELAGWDETGFGWRLDLSLGTSGLVSLFGHCEKLLVHEGQAVTRGQTVATVGSSGNSQGCHLHLAIYRVNDRHFLDPAPFMKD